MKLGLTLSLLALWRLGAGGAEPVVGLDADQARRLADPAAHRTPTVVALWSPGCSYCRRNLSVFGRLARTDTRVRLITVAAGSGAAGLAEPLDRLGIPGKRYACSTETTRSLDARWRGEIPRTLFFDGRGGAVALSGTVGEDAARRALGI